jgi:ferredoxin-thioredoxin reductase catalytic chain
MTADEVERLLENIARDAVQGGYILNPDQSFTRGLAEGLAVNQARYGYISCPCRIASGREEEDRDIVCPCDYRDSDLAEFGSCYCALYVAPDVARGEREVRSIPERRPPRARRKTAQPGRIAGETKFAYPVWRCRVCGYLCAREGPPEVCPICKVKKERFERFL